MVDSISTNTNEIYQLWRRDMMLKSKMSNSTSIWGVGRIQL